MIMLRFFCTIFVVLLATNPAAAHDPTPVGVWLDQNECIKVRIVLCGDDQLCGKIVWFRWPNDEDGLPLVDLKNSDPLLRSRPLLGLSVLYDLRRVSEGVWEGGKIYNPEDGENYRTSMSMQDDGALRVRLYKFFPLFGETQIWTRVRR